MSFWKEILCLFLFIGFWKISDAQHAYSEKEVKSLEKEADFFFYNDQFRKALPLYLQVDSLLSDNPEILVKIGKCYLSGDISYKCLPYFEKARSLHYTKESLDYLMARAYHLNHRLDTAIAFYEIAREKAVTREEVALMDRYIANCRVGIELMKHPIKVFIENIGPHINTNNPEYAPVISGDEKMLMFTSVRKDSYGGLKDPYGDSYEDIYVSRFENGQWSTPRNIGPPINTPYNDATINLSEDSRQLFVYQNDSRTGNGDIYVSTFKNKQWLQPAKLSSKINTRFWEPGSCMTADKKILFFSSDKRGGYGGTDIYVSKKQANGVWGEAKNLGPMVNTEEDEDAPFILEDGKSLYFSSRGHNSMGGFDIFTTQYSIENDQVTPPKNIGYPINTAADEIFFVWSADGRRGYFSAEREDSYGDRDIYIIHRPSMGMNLILMEGKISGRSNRASSATIYVIDNETQKVVDVDDSISFEENYAITLAPTKNYAIFVQAENFLPFSATVHVADSGFYELKKDIVLYPLQEGSLAILNNVFFDQGSAELKKESYGELNRYLAILRKKPFLIVELASHAFDFNDSLANLKLSQQRAEAIVAYLVKEGGDSTRLKAAGYGDRFKIIDDDSQEARIKNTRSELIILQNIAKGQSKKDTKGYYNDRIKAGISGVVEIRNEEYTPVEVLRDSEDRMTVPEEKYLLEKKKNIYFSENARELQKIREIKDRIETGQLKPVIVKGLVTDGGNEDPVGAKVQLLDCYGNMISEAEAGADGKFELQAFNAVERKYAVSVYKKGYKYDSKGFILPPNGNKKIEVVHDLVVHKLEIGKRFILRNIYFDYNKASLKKESYPELNKLVKLLKQNPELKIEIAGHSDSKGSSRYNKKLSQDRSEIVFKYLISKGISEERLRPVGYGEEKPLASNDDELEGRELNRRIELEVIK